MSKKINGAAKWVAVTIAIIGIVGTGVAAVTSNTERITSTQDNVQRMSKRLQRIEWAVVKLAARQGIDVPPFE